MTRYLFQDIVLGDEGLLKGPFGSDLKRSLYVDKSDNTYKVYLQENILNETLEAGEHYISKEYYESKMSRYAVKNNDFIVTCDGTLGEIYQLKDIKEPGIISSSLLRITLNPRIVDYDYFYYLFKILIKKELIVQGNNSVLKHLPGIEVIRKHAINLPDLDTQKKIGLQLKNIDLKIKNNKRINEELETIGKTLYDYWFLQFEFPNEEGKPYKSSGGKMVYNEELKREIPEGWTNTTLSSISTMYQPKTFDAKLLEKNGIYRVYGAGGYMGKYHEYNHDKAEMFISCRGSCGNIYKSMPYSLITGNAMIVHPIDINAFGYLYLTLVRFGVKNCITGSVQPQITRDSLNDWKLAMPDIKTLEKFNRFSTTVFKKIEEIIEENEKLESIRDFLLPLLMNGQVSL